MEIGEAIRTRRSIRKFSDREVPKADLEAILKAACLAPSAKNSQTWRFTVVRGAKQNEMCEVFQKSLDARIAEGQDTGSAHWTLDVMRQAPVTVFVHSTDGIHPWKARKEHESWWDLATVQSIGAAIENLLLAATDRGLGTLWIADIWEAYGDVNQWLGLDLQLVAAVSVGYPAIDPPASPRKPLADIVTWVE